MATLALALAGCASSGQDWHGFVLGRVPRVAAAADPLDPEPHVVLRTDAPAFPWQEAQARLDRAGAVMAVTLATRCCGEMGLTDRSPTPEEWDEIARQERAVPDRFRDGTPSPPVRMRIGCGTRARSARATWPAMRRPRCGRRSRSSDRRRP